ncbi:hypothetical protein QFC22_003964 [Naganishia vaughanmartiniae]|uniref:Uncharacterized protein n=1 Tax=Naganishia vaughanmartiniae TaxID=1424756 RepID=A0ACC2X4V0_9TREE|nr:hypothetical protein QFC22_003964 [Naganishia vaughanmartiniae]
MTTTQQRSHVLQQEQDEAKSSAAAQGGQVTSSGEVSCQHGKRFKGSDHGHFCKGVAEKCWKPMTLHVIANDGGRSSTSRVPGEWAIRIDRDTTKQLPKETEGVITIKVIPPGGETELSKGASFTFPQGAITEVDGQVKVAATPGSGGNMCIGEKI